MNKRIKNKFNSTFVTCLTVMIAVCFATLGEARPVSYPGGWTVMQKNDKEKSSLHWHYSPTAKYSVGYKGAYWYEKKIQTHSLQLNNLLKRWNQIDSQANFYLKSGVGIAHDTSNELDHTVQPHVYTGLALDWEDRRYFTKYENSYHYFGDFDREFEQSITLGIAPYIGEYGDLHTWLMLKLDHKPDDPDQFRVTPFVRFIKGVSMFEMGISDEGDVLGNVIIRF